jgi:hypothetical protein
MAGMTDPAELRLMLLNERSWARRSLALGAALLASIAPVMWLGAVTNDIILLLASLHTGFALIFGTRWFVGGLSAHSVVSFKLRRLHARDTGLPPARLL